MKRTTSAQGRALIKGFEGFRSTAYSDAGGYSIGYGHHGAVAGQTVTEAEAEELLTEDLHRFEEAVNAVSDRLTQGQFDAAVSLAYNIGTTAFSRSNVAALMAANPSPRQELEQEWKEWRMASGRVNSALEKRRAEEYEHYTKHSNSITATVATVALCAAVVTVAAITLS